MILETSETLDRYNISVATLYNKRKVIEEAGGIIEGASRSDGNLYKTSVLDELARAGKLGTKPRKAILSLDHEKETTCKQN